MQYALTRVPVQPVRSVGRPVPLDPDDVGAHSDEQPAGGPGEVVGQVEDTKAAHAFSDSASQVSGVTPRDRSAALDTLRLGLRGREGWRLTKRGRACRGSSPAQC